MIFVALLNSIMPQRTILNADEQDRIDKARERRKRMKIVEEELSRLDLAEK